MIALPSNLFWRLITVLSALATNTVSAGELTSSDLQRWLDPHNRADIGNFHQFLETIDAERGGGFDGIDGWRIDYSISFEGMPVKFVGAKRYEDYVYLTLANDREMDVQAIAYRTWDSHHHLTLDFAFTKPQAARSHRVFAALQLRAPYQYCIDFVNEDRYVLGSSTH